MKMKIGLSRGTAIYLRFATRRKKFKYHLWRGVRGVAYLLLHSYSDSSQATLRNHIGDIVRKHRWTMRGVRELRVITCYSSDFRYGELDGIKVYSLVNTDKSIWGYIEGKELIIEVED
ncbi:MAG TPA: hypothetical protein PLR34_09605 [Bacteroidales bacterium]|nr:hypothetical protein [Bacteroidales bacterium]